MTNMHLLVAQLQPHIPLQQRVSILLDRYTFRQQHLYSLSYLQVCQIDNILAFLLLSLTILFGHYT